MAASRAIRSRPSCCAAIRAYGLPAEPLSRLIDEHQFDLYNDPMPTLAALEGYVHETSSALFALAARVLAPPSAEIEHLARHAGFAYGFVQVIASLPRDAARRQLFLPLQLLQSHGSSMEEVFSGKQTPKVRAAVDQLIGEAREHLQDRGKPARAGAAERRGRRSCRWCWCGAILRGCRAPTMIPSCYASPSRFSILWTLWRASRSKTFKGG